MGRPERFPHTIEYTSRPALLLLLSCGVGLMVWYIGLGWYGVLLLSTLSVALISIGYVYPQLYGKLATVGLYTLLGACFAIYTDTRYDALRSIPAGETLYSTDVTIHHPVTSSQSSHPRYSAHLHYHGKNLHVLLMLPQGDTIPSEVMYGGHLRATVDITGISKKGHLPPDSYARYLLSEGFQALATLQRIEAFTARSSPTLLDRARHFRAEVIGNFGRQPTASLLTQEQRGILYALTLGERAYLSDTARADFRSSGLAHILAVSGFHLGIIYALLSILLRHLIYPYRYRHLRYLLLFLGVTSYALVCGASSATLRALLMCSLVLMAQALDRPSDPIQTLSLTVVLILIGQPLSFLNAGLVLSVSAVWGIIVFLPLFRSVIHPSSKVLSYIGDLLFVCISAQIGILPFLLLYFRQAVFTLLWSNIPTVLVSSVLVPFGLVMLILSTLMPLPALLMRAMSLLIETMLDIVSFFAQISEGLTLRYKYDLVLVILYFGIIHCIYYLTINVIRRKR